MMCRNCLVRPARREGCCAVGGLHSCGRRVGRGLAVVAGSTLWVGRRAGLAWTSALKFVHFFVSALLFLLALFASLIHPAVSVINFDK